MSPGAVSPPSPADLEYYFAVLNSTSGGPVSQPVGDIGGGGDGQAPPANPYGGESADDPPPYNAGDIVGWPPAPDEGAAGSNAPGIFDGHGLFVDGRVVPNIWKVMNQDLWKTWGRSSGSEAAITFLFVMAMSGALSLPQFANDIPNIPTLLGTAMNEADEGEWLKAFQTVGDLVGALGFLGELAGGAEALGSTLDRISLDAVMDAVLSSPDYAPGQSIRLLACQTWC